MAQIDLATGSAPGTPASGKVSMYAKTDGYLYAKNDAGVESRITGSITLGTAVASTSGTSIDFTSIPAGTKRITINFVGVSTSSTSIKQIQIGDSGGVEATGYSCVSGYAAAAIAYTSGFAIGSNIAADTLNGSIVLTLVNPATFTWAAFGLFGQNTGTVYMYTSAGSKSLSAELDRVRITTVNGTDTFDAGSINIAYE